MTYIASRPKQISQQPFVALLAIDLLYISARLNLKNEFVFLVSNVKLADPFFACNV